MLQDQHKNDEEVPQDSSADLPLIEKPTGEDDDFNLHNDLGFMTQHSTELDFRKHCAQALEDMRIHKEMLISASTSGLLSNSSQWQQAPSVLLTEFETAKESCFLKRDDVIAKIKIGAEKQSDILYIYYTGHTDIDGNWCLEGSEKVRCVEIL